MGAAMGYAHMTSKPGVVMLHVTPGIGHALGNLFNAYKSHKPILILCGQQHSNLILQEPLLASDTVHIAEKYTKWAYEIRTPEEFPMVMQRALKLVITPPMGPVFLSIPWDHSIQNVPNYTPGSAKVTRIATNYKGASDAIQQAAQMLKSSQRPPVIIAGDGVGAAQAWHELQQVAKKTGAYVYSEGLSSMMNYPPNDYHYQGELPGLQEQIQRAIRNPNSEKDAPPTDTVFLCGFNAQAQIVAYNYSEGELIPQEVKQVIYLHNDPWEIGKNRYGDVAILGDIKLTLAELAQAIPDELPAAQERIRALKQLYARRQHQLDSYIGELDKATNEAISDKADITIQGKEIATTLGKLQMELQLDESLVFVNEALSDSPVFQKSLHYQDPISYFSAEGGSLGFSMPAGIGIKLAVREKRTIINVVGDGSTLFYPQTWWTVARFRLPILYIITNNREYKTLKIGLQEIEKLYQWSPHRGTEYLDLNQQPTVDFIKIAASFGIDGSRVAQKHDLEKALRHGLKTVIEEHEPYVLEILTNPRLESQEMSQMLSDIQLSPMEAIL
jgi:benzoylformate decarboxylase